MVLTGEALLAKALEFILNLKTLLRRKKFEEQGKNSWRTDIMEKNISEETD